MEQNLVWINGGITINAVVSVKNAMFVGKKYVWNSATFSCKSEKYLVIITDTIKSYD